MMKTELMLVESLHSFVCHACNKDFLSAPALKRHEATHYNIFKHKCNTCWKSFKDEDSLKQHVEKHFEVKPFSCSKCQKSFMTLLEIQRHLRYHAQKTFLCDLCGKALKSEYNLKHHKANHEGGIKPYACSTCGKSFYTKFHLTVHLRIHTGEKPHLCTKCGASFAHKHTLGRHQDMNLCGQIPNHQKPFICGQCEKGFGTRRLLKQHMNRHLGRIPESQLRRRRKVSQLRQLKNLEAMKAQSLIDNLFEINISNEIVRNPEDQQVMEETGHFEIEMPSNEFADIKKAFPILSRNLGTGSNFASVEDPNGVMQLLGQYFDEDRENVQVPPRSECLDDIQNTKDKINSKMLNLNEVPSIIFNGDSTLGQSLSTGLKGFSVKSINQDEKGMKLQMTMSNEDALEYITKPFSCGLCGKRFKDQWRIKYHMRKHSDERPYQCTLCDKGFKWEKSLIVHMTDHSMPDKYQCPIEGCHQFFRTEWFWKQHVRTHEKESGYSCRVCDRRFFNSSNLKRHMISHMTEFHCSICKETYSDYQIFQSHMAEHHEPSGGPDQESLCDECGQTFVGKQQMREHMMSCHNIDLDCEDSLLEEIDLTEIIDSTLTQTEKSEAQPDHDIACEFCGKNFEKEDDRRRHMKAFHKIIVHHDDANPPSRDANSSSMNGEERVVEILEEPASGIVCEMCGRSFSRNYHKKRHMLNCHKIVMKPSALSIQRAISHATALSKENSEGEDQQAIVCEECGKVFKRKYNKKAHMVTCHKKTTLRSDATPERALREYDDSSVFMQLASARQRCKSDAPPALKCDLCDKTFTREFSKKRHLMSRHKIFQQDGDGNSKVMKDQHADDGNPMVTKNSHDDDGNPTVTNDSDVIPNSRFMQDINKFKSENQDSAVSCLESFNSIVTELSAEQQDALLSCTSEYFTENMELKVEVINNDAEYQEAIQQASLYGCGDCNNLYYTITELKKHMLADHQADVLFQCDLCDKEFVTHEDLVIHSSEHSEEAGLACEDCGKSFATFPVLRRHRNNRCFHVCKICGMEFCSTGLLRAHARRTHEQEMGYFLSNDDGKKNGKKILKAVNGQKESVDGADVRVKVEIIEESGEETADCQFSDGAHYSDMFGKKVVKQSMRSRKVPTRYEVNDVITAKKETKETGHSKKSKVAPNDDEHDETRVSDDDDAQYKLFSCGVCGKQFTKEWRIKYHMAKHNDEKLYDCKICNKKFKWLRSLEQHTKIHVKPGPHKCPYVNCSKSFLNIRSLKEHTKEHDQGRRYACSVCPKKFTKSYNLRRHVLSHTGLKPFGCCGCSKAFTTNDSLRLHMTACPLALDTIQSRGRQKSTIADVLSQVGDKTFNDLIQLEALSDTIVQCYSKDVPASLEKHAPDGVISHSFQSSDGIVEIHDSGVDRNASSVQTAAEENGLSSSVATFSCASCKGFFADNATLEEHVKLRRANACKKCKAEFCHLRSRLAHARLHEAENNVGRKLYSCRLCQRNFATWVSLKRHRSVAHCPQRSYR